MIGFSKFPCSLPDATIFNKSNDYRGMWQAQADGGNCFTFYINIYAFGALFRLVRGEGFAADPPATSDPLQNYEVGGFSDPQQYFFQDVGSPV